LDSTSPITPLIRQSYPAGCASLFCYDPKELSVQFTNSSTVRYSTICECHSIQTSDCLELLWMPICNALNLHQSILPRVWWFLSRLISIMFQHLECKNSTRRATTMATTWNSTYYLHEIDTCLENQGQLRVTPTWLASERKSKPAVGPVNFQVAT